MRLVPTGETASASVNRYLLAQERNVITVRQHPGMLVPPAATAAGASLVATAVTVVHSGGATSKYIVWLLTIFLVLRFLASVGSWSVSYIVMTQHRLLLVSGLFRHKVAASQLDDLKVMVSERSAAGRILGYGAFRIGPDGPNQLIIDYIPYPEQLHLEVNGLLYRWDDE
jgi:hypothetical protein